LHCTVQSNIAKFIIIKTKKKNTYDYLKIWKQEFARVLSHGLQWESKPRSIDVLDHTTSFCSWKNSWKEGKDKKSFKWTRVLPRENRVLKCDVTFPNCNKILIFRKYAFFIMYFQSISAIPIISKNIFCDAITLVLYIRELKHGRFWATDVNRKFMV